MLPSSGGREVSPTNSKEDAMILKDLYLLSGFCDWIYPVFLGDSWRNPRSSVLITCLIDDECTICHAFMDCLLIRELANGRSLAIDKVRKGELTFDPEIEKTARRLRRETKQYTEEASTSYEDGKDITLEFGESSGESEEEVMAIVPERTINDMTSPDLNQHPLCIEYPDLEVNFELKSGLIHLLPTFRGLAGEDPHKHLKEFHVVCSGMRPQGVTEEQIKLRAFPFSLADQAKDWLYFLPSGSVTTWNDLKRRFLEKYFLPRELRQSARR
ncbi:hypothetical protein Sango_1397700 [Sesamum angolense]|uniref:Retrotransposon gag domain-containing protein n=1 Tax=Sesamum angolense TaxID=2727404 RepID=A0AAE1WU45_9LAMI|nr:hypothetical protein Sango_1397700 [Sesamum angolense]